MKSNPLILTLTMMIFLLFLSAQNALADEIHLKSGAVIKGTIIQVTPKYIEYDPEGSRPFDMMPRDQVTEIVYEDGSSVRLMETETTGEKDDTQAVTESDEKIDENIVIKMKPKTESEKDISAGSPKDSYVEFELGWNGYVGLGARLEYLLFDSFSINGGLGLCLWGYRLSAGTRYYLFDYPFGPAFGLGIAYNTGYKNIEMDAEIQDSAGNKYNDKLIFNFKPVTVVNLTLLYSFRLSSRNKMYFELGYGIRLSDDNYTYKAKNTSEDVILSKETKDTFDMFQPGGVIFSIGFGLAI